MNLQLPCIWSDTVSFYSSAFSLTKFSSLCLLYTACSARQSLPVSVYQSWAVPSKFLIKTTSSSVCYSSTLLHSVSWWIHQNQNLLQGFSRQSLLFFFSPLSKSFVPCSSWHFASTMQTGTFVISLSASLSEENDLKYKTLQTVWNTSSPSGVETKYSYK